jgi:four helix bundle protein
LILAVCSLPSRPLRAGPRPVPLRGSPDCRCAHLLVRVGCFANSGTQEQFMPFQVEELSLELIGELVPLMQRIRARDKALEDQLRRAACSIGQNCAEAAFSDPGNRRARLFTAAGSANETQHALRQAVAWRLITARDAQRPLALVRRIVAILWKLTRG